MNRSHTAETYLAILDKVRAARPDIALSGDFIVGFPGETEEDFTATLNLVDEVGYASAYSFKYSPRPGTPAATMEDQIAPEIMDERLQRLQARITAHQVAFNRASIGKETEVLIERKGRFAGPDDRPVALAPVGACRNGRGSGRHPARDSHSRRSEQHDGRAAHQGGRLMARRDPAVANDCRPCSPRARIRAALPARPPVRRLRPSPDHHRAAAWRAHFRARQSRADRG